MATSTESRVVYVAAVAQGIALVELAIGIKAEGKSLEAITKPITSTSDTVTAAT
jgi:hypothetical protein